MRHKRSWEEMNCPPRPLVYEGWVDLDKRPSTFKWEQMDFPIEDPPKGTARLYYRIGWTALVVWNGTIYFADEILGFESMIDLARERFPRFALQSALKRDYSYEF